MQARKLLAMALCFTMLLSTFVVGMSLARAEISVPPYIESYSPIGIADAGTNIMATFSQQMNTTSGEAAFSMTTVSEGGAVGGAFKWNADNTVMTFTPSGDLSPSTAYSVTIDTSALDTDGEALVAPLHWIFNTAAAKDTKPPTISGFINGQEITDTEATPTIGATFSDDVALDSSKTVITIDGKDVTSSSSVSASEFTYPTSLLSVGRHTVKVSIQDTSGNKASQSWTVNVDLSDTTAPSVIGILPVSGQTNVGVDTNIAVTFSEAMDHNSVDLQVNGVRGTTSWSGNTMTFNPSSSLDNSKTYSVTVSGKDESGNSMKFSWSFTTDDGQAPSIVNYTPVGDEVSVNTSVSAEFSEAMNQKSVVLTVEGVNGTISWSGNTITLRPSQSLAKGSLYSVNVSGTDLGGTPVKFNWNFSTEGGIPMKGGEGAISGLVRGTNGKGIGGAMVLLNDTVSATTDTNGAFSITNVTSGSYDLVVSKDGYDSVQKKVNVTSGLTSVVSLNIKGSVVRPLISDGSIVFMVIGGLALGVVTLSMIWKRKSRLI